MNRSEIFWDKAANTYDQEEKKDEQAIIRIIEKTRKYLNMSDIVLDFGCGTGQISNEIAGNVKLIHALDTSSKMIEIAKEKAGGRKIENSDYTHTSIFDGRYKPGSLDVILAFYILHLVEDTDKVMERMKELLKPGGLMISATPCLGGKNSFPGILISLGSKVGLVPKIRAFKISELEEVITSGNFEIVESECLQTRGQQYFIVARKRP
jgi:2-polyprenyl-3-methyl-5-hydroxy-6-metoxy-1,4-benzoquinol methylase